MERGGGVGKKRFEDFFQDREVGGEGRSFFLIEGLTDMADDAGLEDEPRVVWGFDKESGMFLEELSGGDFPSGCGRGFFGDAFEELGEDLIQERVNDVILIIEMAIESALAKVRFFGDHFDRTGIDSFFIEKDKGGIKETFMSTSGTTLGPIDIQAGYGRLTHK